MKWNLKKRGKLYSLRAYIPAELAGKHRTSSGKPKTEKLYALGTSDRQEALRKARLLVPKVVQDIYGTPDPQEYEWKPDTERLIRYANHPDERFESPLKPIERVGVRRDTHPDLEQAAENIAFQRGLKVATDWVAKATGKVVLGTAADAYLSFMEQRGRPANERTRKRRVTHIKEFAAWWDEDSTPLNALKPMDADRFIGHLREDGNAPATINSKISSMSNLWRWASTRGHADSNIWSDQSVSVTSDRRVRPFRPQEIQTVKSFLSAGAPSLHLDLFTVLLFTGCRIEEICSLRVHQVTRNADGEAHGIEVVDGKAGIGTKHWIPILHAAPLEVLERRARGKASDAMLFEGLTQGAQGWSHYVARALRRKYRQALGLPLAGKCEVDNHSLRRVHATAAENAGLRHHEIDRLHRRRTGSIALDTYSSGPDASLIVELQKRVSDYIAETYWK